MLAHEVKKWMGSGNAPFMISGPCSVESPEQFKSSVLPLIAHTDYVRGGIWKPRTRPGYFEGHGEKALQWVNALKEEYPFRFATEIATTEHVELALKHQVDMVWIGARTTVNPFQISELAEALQGTTIPVLIKNPIHPDLALWTGAIERCMKAGIHRLAAVHRGFHSYSKTTYRNPPLWQIPLDLKREFPNLPLICDPSHIAGERQWIGSISQQALDLNYDGLMIEVHHHPDQALSDPKQQLSPEAYVNLLNGLQKRTDHFEETLVQSQLEVLRESIDQSDQQWLDALATRMRSVKHIGKVKEAYNVAIFQPERWSTIFETRKEWAAELGLNEAFTSHLLRHIHEESIKLQTEIFQEAKESTNMHNE